MSSYLYQVNRDWELESDKRIDIVIWLHCSSANIFSLHKLGIEACIPMPITHPCFCLIY